MDRSMSRGMLAYRVRIVLALAMLILCAPSLGGAVQRELPAPGLATPDLNGALPWDVPEDGEPMVVHKVVDGDTLQLTHPGNDWYYATRLIGIQAPEMDGPYTRRGCYGPEAKAFLTELLPVGTGVIVQRDITDEDRNGRRRRHVFVPGPDGSVATRSPGNKESDVYLLSEVLVLGGYAEARGYPPDDLYDDVLAEAEEFARDDRAGLWRACQA